MLESVGLIWKSTRMANSRSSGRSKERFRFVSESHQTTTWTPTAGPSRMIVANRSAGDGSRSAPLRPNPKSSSAFRNSRKRWTPNTNRNRGDRSVDSPF